MADNTQYPISIDDIFQSTPIGSLDKAIGNNLYGFNHDQTPGAVPYNREQQGFIFFVRPQLNLQLDNIRNSRKFMPLASDANNTTIHRFIRTTLDPRLMTGYTIPATSLASTQQSKVSSVNGVQIPPIQCPLTNNEMAFIPVLTNNAISSSGWPDPVVPLFTSRSGRYNESYAMVDGLVENFEQYSIDVTFRNTVSDPIVYMFYIWTLYASYVFNGKFVPYPDFIMNNRLDYNTRLYRIRLDRNKRKVTKIMSTGPAIPVASTVGAFGDFNIEDPFSSANKEISVRFQCMGFEIFDDILILEFNTTVQMFKPEMRDANRATNMILIPKSISYMFQYRAYPRIDPSTHNFEWWVDRDLFDLRTQAFIETLNQAQQIDVEDADNGNTDSDVTLGQQYPNSGF